MDNELSTPIQGLDSSEIQEWLESLDSVLQSSGPEVASYILERLEAHAKLVGIEIPFTRFLITCNRISRATSNSSGV